MFAITNVTILLLLILCIYRLGRVLKTLNWVGDRILGLKLLRNPAGLGGKALPHGTPIPTILYLLLVLYIYNRILCIALVYNISLVFSF